MHDRRRLPYSFSLPVAILSGTGCSEETGASPLCLLDRNRKAYTSVNRAVTPIWAAFGNSIPILILPGCVPTSSITITGHFSGTGVGH